MASWLSSALDKVASVGTEAYQAVDAWTWTEDSESAPKTYQQQKVNEVLAEGSALPKVAAAENATGDSILNKKPTMVEQYQPFIIGGGVLVVVLFGLALMMRGK